MFKVKNKDTKRLYWRRSSVLTYVTFFSSVFIVDEDHVSVCWDLNAFFDRMTYLITILDRIFCILSMNVFHVRQCSIFALIS